MNRLGEYLPSHVKEEKIFVEGGVFLWKKYEFRFGGGSAKDRRFVILNKYPKKDDVIIAVSITTQIEKRKAARPPEVLVEIKKTEYTPLRDDSIVDCDSQEVWPKTKLQKEISKGEIEFLFQLPLEKLNELREAVGKAITLNTLDKRLIFPED